MQINRRTFLKKLFWTGFFGTLTTGVIGSLRFFFPRVSFEQPSTFNASYPHEYLKGTVSTKFQETHGVWIVRNEEGFYALLAKCTHLGCAPVWNVSIQKFKCPCHGSGFTREGINYEGPAPTPLERVKIYLSEDKQIIVDKSVSFRYERDEWDKPGAFLKYS